MRVPSSSTNSVCPELAPTLLNKYTNLEEYIRATNPAPNGTKDLSEIRNGDIICLEGSPCKITRISPAERLTFVQGVSLIDDITYSIPFNHCYGIIVGTFSGELGLLRCTIYDIRKHRRGTIMELGPPSHGGETRFEMELPNNELGISTFRQWEYTLRRPKIRASVLVSRWGDQKQLVGFRLSGEMEWHVAPRSSHWCLDCVSRCCRM